MKRLCSAAILVTALSPYSVVVAGESVIVLGAGVLLCLLMKDLINTYFRQPLM